MYEHKYKGKKEKPLYKRVYENDYSVDLLSGSILTNKLERWIYNILVTRNSE